MNMFEGQEDKKKGAKGSFDAGKGTVRRQQQGIQLRKGKRDGALEKKRRAADGGAAEIISNPTDPWCYTESTPASQVPPSLLPACVELIRTGDMAAVYQGVFLIRKMLAVEDDAPNVEVIESGVCPALIHAMTVDTEPKLQFEASWALSNIASGCKEHTEYVVQLGAVPHWISHLSSPSPDCREQATWALGNVAGEGHRLRDHVLGLGAMGPLLKLIEGPIETVSLMQNASWALSNFCRFKPQPQFEDMRMALPVVCNLVQHTDIDVAIDAAWALSYISDGKDDRIELVIDSGIIPTVIEMLRSTQTKFHMPGIRVVGNICAGDDTHTQAVLNAGVLSEMPALLHPSNPRNVRKETAWALSNIAAGTKAQIQSIINAQLVPILLQTVKAYEIEVKKEALWAISNIATNGAQNQVDYLMECGAMEILVETLTQTDPKVSVVTLEAIAALLDSGAELMRTHTLDENPYLSRFLSCEGDVAIEGLQAHTNEGVRELVMDILIHHFNVRPQDGAPVEEMREVGEPGEIVPDTNFNF